MNVNSKKYAIGIRILLELSSTYDAFTTSGRTATERKVEYIKNFKFIEIKKF